MLCITNKIMTQTQLSADTPPRTDMTPVIGLMSGTSADGIDGCVILTDGQNVTRTGINLCQPYRPEVATAVLAARHDPAGYLSDPHRRQALITAITDDHTQVTQQLIQAAVAADLPPVQLIGFHGQTVYHNPAAGRTIQLGDGQQMARQTGLPVIYDFRRADMDAGGQGAPLAPIYHQILLRQAGLTEPAGFLNLGGVANLTVCSGDDLLGFDTGPANGLMDAVCQNELGKAYDKDGTLAAAGRPCPPFIDTILADPWFLLSGPRSLDWAQFTSYLQDPGFTALPVEDKLASLVAVTAQSLARALARLPFRLNTLVVAGGGVHNKALMRQIETDLPDHTLIKTAEHINASSDMIEAELIALLAARHQAGLVSSWPQTTGTSAPQIAGVRAEPLQIGI